MPHDTDRNGQLCLYRLFQATAMRHPERVAVIAPDGVRSYAELDADVTRLAAALAQLGIAAGERLALLLDRGADAVTALLASIRLGATFVAMDPAFPAARLAAILTDCQPRLVLHHEQHAALLAGWERPVSTFSEVCQLADDPPAPLLVVAGDAPMYVIYTSGSTGRPKGIVQTFQTIRNLVRWENDETDIRFDGRVLQNSSLAFDVSLQEILSTLTTGGTLVVSGEDERLDPDFMIQLLRRQRVNVVFFSVSTLTRLFAIPERLDTLPGTLTDIVTAGEQLYVNNALRAYLLANPRLRLHNHYGVSESHVVTAHTISGALGEIPARVPIGVPVAGARVYLRRADGSVMQPGEIGEVVIAGECLALGYLNRPEEQEKRFVIIDDERHYVTGDLAFQHPGGEFEFVGRADQQLKIRGHLVEPGDVEAALKRHPAITDCSVDVLVTADGERQLATWYTTTVDCPERDLRTHLAGLLPSFMVPSRFQLLAALPVGPTGKVDREALRRHAGRQESPAPSDPAGEGLEQRVLATLRRVLESPNLEPPTRFFDAGATSLTLVRAAQALSEELDAQVRTIDLFRFPSTAQLTAELGRRGGAGQAPNRGTTMGTPAPARWGLDEPLAVIGIDGRFPGARDVHALWHMLVDGRHGLTPHSGGPTASWWIPDLPHPVGPPPMVGLLADAYRFEPEFFGYSEREAEWTDPQQRLLLMCAYAALESAGHPPSQGGHVGVYVGGEFPGYIANVRPHVQSMGDYLQALIGNDKDFLATRVAHKLNLTGPAVTVQTACSTSLVSVHLARQALLLGECDLALAGGVSLQFPQEFGNRHEEGLIYSPDGMTRPFDEAAAGTNVTSGVGLVVLKRLTDAMEDGDTILALIRGTAINNDGADKVGYTAPSASGQARVIRAALRSADLTPADIDFVEGHGTATPLGDAVELAALHDVFGAVRDKQIRLGSIKGNIGHTNRAAGIAGLIKAVLAMHHGLLPGTVGHRRAGLELHLEDGPFVVSTSPVRLRAEGHPSRAGVSSFGFGGTNAHVVVEQWRRPASPEATDRPYLLTLTADRADQITALAAELAEHLDADPDITVADAAYTRNTGHDRRALTVPIVASGRDQLINRLRDTAVVASLPPARVDGIVFLLPGGGRSEVSAGAQLYQRYAAFRDRADEVLDELDPANAVALRDWLNEPIHCAQKVAGRSELLHPLIFLLSRATALLLMDWGIRPRALVGSSLGEFAAVTISGALSVRDAALLVEERGRLEDTLAPAGGMLSAELTWNSAVHFESGTVTRAGHNSRGHVLFAGSTEDIGTLEERLAAASTAYRRLPHRRPNHTALMGPTADAFRRPLQFATWREPQIPIISCIDGAPAGIDRLAEPDHWVRHITQPIRFAEALDSAASSGGTTVFLEVGPPAGLADLVEFHFADDERFSACAVLPRQGRNEEEQLLESVGDLARCGVAVDLRRLHADDPGRRVLLPPFPFRGKEYLLPLPREVAERSPTRLPRQPRARWTYRMTWQATPRDASTGEPDGGWLLIGSNPTDLDPIVERLTARGSTTILASAEGCEVARAAGQLRESLQGQLLTVCYMDSARSDTLAGPLLRFLPAYRELVRSLPVDRVNLVVATRGSYRPDMDQAAGPAALTTAVIVAAQEQPGLRTRHVDFSDGPVDPDALLAEARSGGADRLVVYHCGDRSVPRYQPVPLLQASGDGRPRRFEGTCLVTGGLGLVGFQVARYLGERGAKLLIVGRTDATAPDSVGAAAQRKLSDLKAAGIKVCYQRADVTACGELAAAVEAGEAVLGPVRGVIHAAAAIGGDGFLSFLHDTAPEALLAQVDPKVSGLACLDEILRGHQLQFRCAFSSNSVILGGLGYASYAAANALMGSLISQLGQWQVIDWDVWDLDRSIDSTDTVVTLGTSVAAEPMPLPDALSCLSDILYGTTRRVLVSTTDLEERVRLVERLTGAAGAHPGPGQTSVGDAPDTAPASLRDVAREAWRRALRTTVDDHANFVSLGGDSLSAIKVVLEVNRRLGCSLSAQDMLRAADFADLVSRIEKSLARAGSGLPDHLLTATSQPDRSVTSVLQERWFDMDTREYGHIDLRVKIAGPLDPELASRAVAHLCRRHAILRSRYQPGERLIQQTVDGWSPALRTTDLTGAPDAAVTAAIRDAEARALRRFDLTGEVPFDVELLRLCPTEHVLIGRTHHIAVDGWSFSLMLEDLERVYSRLERGDDPGQLPELPQYAHFAAAQRSYVERGGIAEARAYWQAHFAGAGGPTRLPSPGVLALPDGADPECGRCVNTMLDADTVSRLGRFAQNRRTTVFPVLVSAFVLMLRAVTGEEDLVFGTTAAGRHLPGTEAMIGVFVNPLPVRVDLAGRSGTDEVVRLVEDRLLEFHRRQNYVLADLVEHVEPFVGRDINETFHAYILFQNYPRPESQGPRTYTVVETDDLGDQELAQLRRPHGKLMRDFELIVMEQPDGAMSLNHWYRQGAFTEAQVREWSDVYTSMLHRLLAS